MKKLWLRQWLKRLAVLSLVCAFVSSPAEPLEKVSRTISSVLREPLPPEELSLSENAAEFVIYGPTFTYQVKKTSGVINGVRVLREGREVIAARSPAEIQIDQHRLSSELNTCKLVMVSQGKNKIVLQAQGVLRDATKTFEVNYSILHTFFNDGVVVSAVKLIPRADLPVEQAVLYKFSAQGHFSHYLHKRRDEHGGSADRGSLPEPGKAIRWKTLTSCLEVFSPAAALAIFTDGGAIHLSRTNLDTAVAEVIRKESGVTQVALSQYVVQVAPGDKPYLIEAGEELSFRVGISVAPNRLPHPRTHDLRMFTWIGDENFPYPTDEEISAVAQMGFTVFQMHRAGTPGDPRTPSGEMERVITKVHELGMLFLWVENVDLLFASDPGVQKLQTEGKWSRWQGFNYGGRYKATMDPHCDMVATCLAMPNGLADHRLASMSKMMDRFAVDGMYVDDNLAYANCTRWQEHGHPRQVYDCLIELHEMNWQRRELLRKRCPHLLLVSHCTKAFTLPVIGTFDAQLYGEGYSFGSVNNYWDHYVAWTESLHAQGMMWPGDDEDSRCPASLAYNYDILMGGGQFTQLDWRLFPKKFPYAKGVTDAEPLLARTNNLAQSYFGLYESKPFYFANSTGLFSTKTSLTYATVYHNSVWSDWLIPIANMDQKPQTTSLEIHLPQALGIQPGKNYSLFDVHQRTARTLNGNELNAAFRDLVVPGWGMRLFSLRERSDDSPFHLWGGKRISESWNGKKRELTFVINGPPGLQETIYVGANTHGIQRVLVEGKPAPFLFDPTQRLAYGQITFTAKPQKIEVVCSANGVNKLPFSASNSEIPPVTK